MEAAVLMEQDLLAPIGSQEVWAAGVTYLRSRDARMEESKESGGASFYDKVYEAERPELFFKSQPHRVAAHGEKVYIRRDSSWNVPEPELTLFINSRGQIQGYTIGNDMSSRSIEGENPLYLPQAKVYDRSAALGPGLYVPPSPIALTTVIRMAIRRGPETVYRGEVAISQIKRSLTELAHWLYRESDFPTGCFLMTGTCLVPGNDFTLREGDNVEISIDGIGTLTNSVSYKPNGRNN
jgi:2-dehydro-3-deoxy-D-arabinonate dehydratase